MLLILLLKNYTIIYMTSLKYKIIVFDFDNTLSNMNIHLAGVKLNDIDSENKTIKINNQIKPLISIFTDYNDIHKLLKSLKIHGIISCIASFGSLDNIQKITDALFPNIFDYIITPDNVMEETGKYVLIIKRHIMDPSCPSLYGKNIMLQKIMDKFKIDNPSDILFIDDDSNNTQCAKNINIDTYNNKQGITFNELNNIFYKKNNYIIYKYK